MTNPYLFVDGFDVYPDIATSANGLNGAAWIFENSFNPNLSNLQIVSGRYGGQAIQSTAVGGGNTALMGKAVPSGMTFAVGFALNLQSSTPPQRRTFSLWSAAGGTTLVSISINTNQQLCITAGDPSSTPLATSNVTLTTESWHSVGAEITLGTSGAFNLYQDGLLVATYSGNLGTTPATFASFGFSSQDSIYLQNFVVQYDDVSLKNVATYDGERKVTTQVVNSDSSVHWTPSTGSSNYSLLDSLPVAANPSAYVYANAAGTQDLYGITPLQGVPTHISAVQVRVMSNKTDVTTRILATKLKSGATTVTGANNAVTASYQYALDIYNTDPATSAAWTATGVNAVVIGQTIIE